MSLRWHQNFLRQCLVIAELSKDRRTQVGAILTTWETPPAVLSTGFNGLARGIADTSVRLNEREVKLKLIVHAERNAILNAARMGIATNNSVLYVAGRNVVTGDIYGQWCCSACAIELIQAGVKKIVWPAFSSPSHWETDTRLSHSLLEEAGIITETVSFAKL